MAQNHGTKNPKVADFFTEYGDAHRYKLLEIIGEGSYGVVCAAVDTHTGQKVAVKKITDVFVDINDAIKILTEIRLLRLLRHPDVVEIKSIMVPPSSHSFEDIFVVFEFMESDLHDVIRLNDDLTPEHHRFFLYQMLRALKYMHTANVYHRDLKPQNMLVNANCKLKICDFGLAKVSFSDDNPSTVCWSEYVVTRWYRAPELCGSVFTKYTPAIDIWSIGCIFAELLTGKTLFRGKNIGHQLELITDLLGTPPSEYISEVQDSAIREKLTSMPRKRPVPFAVKFRNLDPLAVDLLQRFLAFDPKDRPTAEQALADPYFKSLAKIEREPSSQPISRYELGFKSRNMAEEDIRKLIYSEILEYHPHILKDHTSGTTNDQFTYLEESGGKSMPAARNHISPPRHTVNSSAIPPGPNQKLAVVGPRQMTEEVHNNDSRVNEVTSGNLPRAPRPPPYVPTGRFAGPVLPYEKVNKDATGAHPLNTVPRSITPRYVLRSTSSTMRNQENSETDGKRNPLLVRQLPPKPPGKDVSSAKGHVAEDLESRGFSYIRHTPITFITKVFHPNIDSRGSVSNGVIELKDWLPSITVNEEPAAPEDALVPEIAVCS